MLHCILEMLFRRYMLALFVEVPVMSIHDRYYRCYYPHIFYVDPTFPGEGHCNHCELELAVLHRESMGIMPSSDVVF